MQKFATTFSRNHLQQGVLRKLIQKTFSNLKEDKVTRLITAIDELVSNSIKYSHADDLSGKIIITRQAKIITCRIEDNGQISVLDFKKVIHHYFKHVPEPMDPGRRGLAMFISQAVDIITFHRINKSLRICFSIFI